MNLFKTLIFTIVVPCAVTVWIPRWLFPSELIRPIGRAGYFGLFPIAAGAALYLWCAWDFATAGRGTPAPVDPPKVLIARGLYRFTRNPMYVGVLSVLLGEALLFSSPALLGYTGAVFLLFHLFIVFYEEPALGRQFGENYRTYRAAVPRWLPNFNNSAERPAR